VGFGEGYVLVGKYIMGFLIQHRLNWFLSIAFIFPLWCAAVQSYVPKMADPVLEPWRWKEARELSGYGVICMDEAEDGTLCFGAIGGVLKYNGMQIERIPLDDQLKSNIGFDQERDLWCNNVLCLPDGRVLAVIESALALWDNERWTVIQNDLGYTGYDSRLVQAADATVWLLTSDALRQYNQDLTQDKLVISALVGERLTAICLDDAGNVWVVKNRPLKASELIYIPLQAGRVLDETYWHSYPISDERPGREASLCSGPDGKIWYVDNISDNPVRSFDLKSGEWHVFEHPYTQKGFFSLMRDRSGTLWAGGPGALFAIRGAESRYYSEVDLGLPSAPLSIFEAADGKWWVMVRGGYVYQMDPGGEQWKTYVGLHFECETDVGVRWFKTDNNHAVSHNLTTGQWVEYTMQDGLVGVVRSLHTSSHGMVWAAGANRGRAAFSVFDRNQWNLFPLPDFGLMIGGVFEAADGTMWFGAAGDKLPNSVTAGGMLQYEVADGAVKRLRHYPTSDFPYAVARIAQTPDGAIWLGSPKVFRHEPTLEHNAYINEIPGVFTQDLMTDDGGDLWVAKGLFGIYRSGKQGWQQYTESGGPQGKMFVDLLLLQDGTVMAASDQGVSRFDGMIWTSSVFSGDFGMSRRDGGVRQSPDGAIWLNFSARAVRTVSAAEDHRGEGQYCTIRYVAERHPPETRIEEHPRDVDAAGNIHISWNGRDPWSDTALEQLSYSWRHNGGKWSPFTPQAGHTFVGLCSGKHVLEVRARDRDFNVDPSPAVIRFGVALPVWKRGWFIAMSLFIVIGTGLFIGMLIWFHDKRLKDQQRYIVEMDQLKTGFFMNISHELNTPLASMLIPLEDIVEEEQDEQKRKELKLVQRNARRIEFLIGQLIDFRKLELGKGTLEVVDGDIAAHIRNAVELIVPLAMARGVRCNLEAVSVCKGWFDPDKLKKIVQNLVGNAVKYSPSGSEIYIALNETRDADGKRSVMLMVEDCGVGIAPDHLQHIFERFYRVPEKNVVDGSGIGLNLTKEIVELLNGEVRAESPAREHTEYPGTRFLVRLPIDREELLKGNKDYDAS
jgi:signal transduction histidine kinase/streptogramin lyase